MILGVGTDLIEIKRMEKACRRPHFCRSHIYGDGKPASEGVCL
ncbi:MAG: hypothetical protein ACLUEJ_10480 [Clostridium sp.]